MRPATREPRSARSTLDIVGERDYLRTLDRRLNALNRYPFDLLIYNAGMDANISDEDLMRREHAVFTWAAARQLPVAFVLAGGYLRHHGSQDHLVDLHRLTIEGAARRAALAA